MTIQKHNGSMTYFQNCIFLEQKTSKSIKIHIKYPAERNKQNYLILLHFKIVLEHELHIDQKENYISNN